jgi:hypothetical protein
MVLLGGEAQVEARFSAFGDSDNLDKIGAWFVPNLSHTQESFWGHSTELHGDVGHVESCFGPFADSVGVGARYMHGLGPTYRRLRNHFGRTRWYS